MATVINATRPTRIIRPKKKVNQAESTPVPDTSPSPPPPSPPPPSPPPPSPPPPRECVVPYCDPDLFKKQRIKRTLMVPFYRITKGVNVTELLTTELSKQLEGYCSIEGYICPKSVSIYAHSCGRLSAANIVFDIVADCLVCFPDEHTVIQCVAKTITQAGIRAGATQLIPGHISPIEVFLSRDMNYNNELFSRIEENDILSVEIIGRRFVLHDTHVTIIGMLLDAPSPSPSPSP